MKRVFFLLLGLSLAALIGRLGWNTWQSANFIRDQGREATVVIGKRYNAERWTSPVPIKKIYTYTAKLEPKYEVLLETDQDLKDGQTLAIRFLTRDLAANLVDYSMRPVVNTLRLRGAEDGTPVKIEDTALFDAMVDKWMGPPAPGTFIRERARPEAAPTNTKPTVPFVFAAKEAGTWDIVWTNSRVQEWILLGLGLMAVQSLLIAAWDHHKDGKLKKIRGGKKFVHPSLRKVEASAPEASAPKLTYVPKPEVDIVLPESQKTAAGAPRTLPAETPRPPAAPAKVTLPVKAASPEATGLPSNEEPARGPLAGAGGVPPTPSKAHEEPTSLNDRETAPPMPINLGDPVLKLRRKPSGGEKPAPGSEAGSDGKPGSNP